MNKNILPLRTVDGAALMSQPLRPPNFVVDTLLAHVPVRECGFRRRGAWLHWHQSGQ